MLLSFFMWYMWASLVAQTVKNLPTNAGDTGLIPGSGRSPGEGNGNPLQYFSLGSLMVRGAWRAPVHGVAESRPRLSTHTHLARLTPLWFSFHSTALFYIRDLGIHGSWYVKGWGWDVLEPISCRYWGKTVFTKLYRVHVLRVGLFIQLLWYL